MKRVSTVLAAWLCLACAAEAQDVIKLKDGKELKGRITKLGLQTITYLDAANKPANLKADDVAEVKLGNVPDILRVARELATAKKLDEAVGKFEAALAEVAANKARDLHKPFILYEWAMVLREKGANDQAIEKLQTLRKECGDCWLRLKAARKAMEIARTVGESALMDVLESMKGESDPVGGEAELELAKLKFAKGDYEEAGAIFTRLANNPTAPYAVEARGESIRCLKALKKTDELESMCTRILSDRANNPLSLQQTAGALLGELLVQKAEKGDRSKWRDALVACAQAIAIGPPAAKDKALDYGSALMTAGRCCLEMEKDAKEDAKKKYRQRAVTYFTEVARAFRGKPLGEAAEKELSQLGIEKKAK